MSDLWGQPVQFTCDDRDSGDQLRLQITPGGNGDWYVAVVRPGERMAIRGVRIATSGGAAFSVPGLGPAIADAYRAMLKAVDTDNSRGAVMVPTRAPRTEVDGH